LNGSRAHRLRSILREVKTHRAEATQWVHAFARLAMGAHRAQAHRVFSR